MVTPPQSSACSPLVFDRRRIRRNRERARTHFPDHAFLFQWSANRLAERLEDIRYTFPLALQIGSRGPLPEEARQGKIGALFTLDCAARPLSSCSPYVQAEEDFLPVAPQSLNLVLSNLNLHSVNDLPGALLQIRQSLKPDGLFLAAMPGGETLRELRTVLRETEIALHGGISPRVFPFADKPQAGALLQRAGFALPVVDSEIVTVTYSDMFALIHDLRFAGETSAIAAREKTYPGKTFFMEAAKRYQESFSDPDGRIRASVEIIFLIGWTPHDSQQKPLPPGSASHSLAEALGAKETPL